MCTNMRIRTDGDYGHRKATIDHAAAFYGVNKTEAVLSACEDAPALVGAVGDVLARSDLTADQKREIAATFDDASGLKFDVTEQLRVGPEK